MTMIQINP